MPLCGAYIMKNIVRRIGYLLAAVSVTALSLLALSGCDKEDSGWYPAGMKLASDEKAEYRLYVPESWTVDMSTGVTSAYVGGSDYSNVSFIGMNLAGGGGVYNAAEYWEKYKTDLEATLTDIKYDESTADGQAMLLDETEALKYSYTATVTGTEYHFMHVICVREGNAYMLTYTAVPAYYDLHAEDVQDIIDNFSWVN